MQLLKNWQKPRIYAEKSDYQTSFASPKLGLGNQIKTPMEGYNAVHNTRTNKTWGVSIYIKDSLEFDLRSDISRSTRELECIWIEVKKETLGTDSNQIIGCIYRPPGQNMDLFNEYINSMTINSQGRVNVRNTQETST